MLLQKGEMDERLALLKCITIYVLKGLCCNAQKELERQKGSSFISFCHSWKILNLCLMKKPT